MSFLSLDAVVKTLVIVYIAVNVRAVLIEALGGNPNNMA